MLVRFLIPPSVGVAGQDAAIASFVLAPDSVELACPSREGDAEVSCYRVDIKVTTTDSLAGFQMGLAGTPIYTSPVCTLTPAQPDADPAVEGSCSAGCSSAGTSSSSASSAAANAAKTDVALTSGLPAPPGVRPCCPSCLPTPAPPSAAAPPRRAATERLRGGCCPSCASGRTLSRRIGRQ